MTSIPTNTDVDPDAIRAEGGRLKELAPQYTTIADYATEADPEWYVWGTYGIALAQLYFASADRIQAILKEFDPATAGLAQRFIDCADDYESADGQTWDDMGRIEGEVQNV
jgi:hypothetical protein